MCVVGALEANTMKYIYVCVCVHESVLDNNIMKCVGYRRKKERKK